MGNMKPGRDEFIQKLSEQFDDRTSLQTRELVSEQIYNVLFDTQLSQLTDTQFGLLSVLLHSENPEESTDVLQAISKTFPDTEVYIKNLNKHKNLLPKGGKNSKHQKELFSRTLDEIYGPKIHFIKGIQKKLLDVFALPDDYTVLKEEFWKGFLNYIGQSSLEKFGYIQNNINIVSYNPITGSLVLSANNEAVVQEFESFYLSILQAYFKKIGYKLVTLNYNISDLQPILNKDKKQEKRDINLKQVVSSIKENVDPRYIRDTYDGKQKEKVEELLLLGKNIFIGGNQNLGKSHLIQAVVEKMKVEGSRKKIVYTTGNKMLNEIQRRSAEDRKSKANNSKTKQMYNFSNAFYDVDTLIIDDIEVIGGTKFYTQHIINDIFESKNTQVIMLSSLPLAQIQRHKRIPLKEGGGDYIPKPLVEIFSPVSVEVQSVGDLTKKQMLKSMFEKNNEPNLFITQEMISGIVEFMAENISPKIYQQVIESIMINVQGNETNISQKIYEIIENITGKTIIPERNSIVDIIIEEFNLDDIKKYINKSFLTGGILGNIDRQKVYNDKYVRSDSIEGVVLRACIYFIKKYYPDESLSAIGENFNRTNISRLYNEANSWLKENKPLEDFLDNKIKLSLKKKYGLQYDI